MNKITEWLNNTSCRTEPNVPLRGLVSFRTGGNADLVIFPKTQDELIEACHILKGRDYFVLGNGTNILFPDEGFRRPIICLAENFSGFKKIDDNTFRALSGTKLVTVCNYALKNSLTGLEFAYGIPGSVGGAVYMNAGAYGGEIKDVLKSVRILKRNGEIKTLDASELDLSYRHSVFHNNNDIILSADFELQKGDHSEIEAKMNELMAKRKEKQPLEYPSAGSTFKRPEGYFAGKLIEDCGLKGFSIGGAQVSEKHAGFVINRGHCTVNDILAVIDYVQRTVFQRFGVQLEPEVRIIR